MVMMKETSTLERAFILARSGEFAKVDDIRYRLRAERYDQVEAHLSGPSIAKQLRNLCTEARRARAADPGETA